MRVRFLPCPSWGKPGGGVLLWREAELMDTSSPYWQQRATVPRALVVNFYRELSTLLGSGIAIIDALQVTVEHSSNDNLALVVQHMQRKLDSGHPLSDGMSEFPRIFSPVALSLIRLGERDGNIIKQLSKLSEWMERDEQLRRKVLSALVYPVFALTLTFVLTLLLFITVIPGFIEMFEDMEIELPLPTKILAILTEAVTSPLAWSALSFGLLAVVLASRSFLESERGRIMVYRFVSTVPVLGSLVVSSGIARFSFAATAMLESGSNVVSGFKLALQASGSPLLQSDAKALGKALEDGETLSNHMATRPEIYPSIAVQLAAVGEESAQMPKMFSVISGHYEEQIEHQIHIVSALLEPVLMSIVAFVVGFVVIAVFLPMYGFIDNLG